MQYVKNFGLVIAMAATLMVFVGVSAASAITLTDANGEVGIGRTIHAVNEGMVKLTTTFKNIECSSSTISGEITNEGGAVEPVRATVKVLTFGSCNCTVTVLKGGALAITVSGSGPNGTVTSTGTEITAECSTIFGKVHCIYSTGVLGTRLGTLTGSANTGTTAIMDIEGGNFPRLETSGICGEKANWDARYVFDNPDTLNVDLE